MKSFYDREPVTGLIITAGAVNALLGGVNAIGTPFILGLAAAGGSIAYRWWMIQRADSSACAKADSSACAKADSSACAKADRK